jgi:tetratricopeptide (TPR) repeat protein
MTNLYGTDIVALSEERRWTRSRLIYEMRQAGRALRPPLQLPDDGNLRRMLRLWNGGTRGLSTEYAALFTAVFGAPFMTGKQPTVEQPDAPNGPDTTDESAGELTSRLTIASTVDPELVALFEGQTESFRHLDRRLGASYVLAQTEAHLEQMRSLLTYSLPTRCRPALAAAVAEAAALAGWQALDLGDPGKAWMLHETAKAAARDSDNAAILAHVTAQQAYALLDLDRVEDAHSLINHARVCATGRIPDLLMSWLWAAEAETLAATGAERQARTALDEATRFLPARPVEGELPFVFLNENHLARWRGNCLARLGAAEAVNDLTHALAALDPTFKRAEAGHRCDLALAYSMRGQHEEARAEARRAKELADRTASIRQRRRINRLLESGIERRDH